MGTFFMNECFFLGIICQSILILQNVAVLLVLLYPVAITGKWCTYEVFLVSVTVENMIVG